MRSEVITEVSERIPGRGGLINGTPGDGGCLDLLLAGVLFDRSSDGKHTSGNVEWGGGRS